MRKEYDFSKAKNNPYVTKVKKQITIRLDEDAIEYFKTISDEIGIPYQSLINLYLRDCAAKNRKLNIDWKWIKQLFLLTLTCRSEFSALIQLMMSLQ